MHRHRRHIDEGGAAQHRALAVEMSFHEPTPHDQDLMQILVTMGTDFPVMQATARSNGLNMNGAGIGSAERLTVEEIGGNGPPFG